jgi:hypothetical protein
VDARLMRHQELRERTFFESLGYLTKAYGKPMPECSAKPFPLNMWEAYLAVKEQIQDQQAGIFIQIMEKGDGSYWLMDTQPLAAPYHFNFLPLQPLHLLQRAGRVEEAALLLSVIAYFRQIVHFPEFRKDGLSAMYEMIENWENELDEEDAAEYVRERQDRETYGFQMLKEIARPCHIHQWQERMERFRINDEWGTRIHKLAAAAWKLYRRYPKKTLRSCFHTEWMEAPDDDGFIIPMDECFSFIWDANGRTAESLVSYLNDSHMEATDMECPLMLRCYDRPKPTVAGGLSFEKAFFNVMEQAAILLYDLDDYFKKNTEDENSNR